MAMKKVYKGGLVGVRISEEINSRIRKEAVETGRTLSDLVRETLSQKWGGQAQEVRAA
jgi:predicted DNA-binding protein